MKELKLALALALLFNCLCGYLSAQMTIDGNVLYGNEWIDYNQQYHKIYIEEDGIYRLSQQDLMNAGIPVGSINSTDFQLFAMGKQIPVHISASGILSTSDYIEFYAKKNRGEVDVHLYSGPEDHFNPYHSIYTDTLVHYLTWKTGATDSERLENTPNNLNILPTAETHFFHESFNVLGNKHIKGKPHAGLYESTFSAGEGFGGAYTSNGSYQLDTDNAYVAGGESRFWIRFTSSGDYVHDIDLSVNNVNQQLDSAAFIDYRFQQISKEIPTSQLPSTSTIQLIGNEGSTDQHATAFVKIKYPREFKFGNQDVFKFKIEGEAGELKYLEITDFDHGNTAPILYDLTNGLRITTELTTGNLIRVVLPASATERELVLFNPNTTISTISAIDEINFTNFDLNQGDYLILSHSKFINDPAGEVQTYANYRASTGFTPIIIDVEELYDQFSYGVNKHAQAIRNFTGFTLENWTVEPEYMFMIGKSRPYFSTRKNPVGQPSYTPTFGHDPSDNLLTATAQSGVPRIPFGRIPVLTSNEIAIYLDKVIAYETAAQTLPQTIEDRERLKRVVHLGGGDPLIQEVIKNNFQNYKGIIEDVYVGANVSSFFKNSDEPVQTSISYTLDSLINNGVNLVTFYGHSSPVALDFNVDNPANYENTGRYFSMFSMGCYGGQIHQKQRNIGEEFVFADQKAAVAFIATGGLSGLGALDAFATSFYQSLSVDHYGQGLGDIIQAVIYDLETNTTSVVNRIVYQQMTLNGDPALKINYETAPDYIVNEAGVQFFPEEPTNRDDITITIPIVNLGKAVNALFNVQIDRILPDGTEITVTNETLDAPALQGEYIFNIPAIGNAAGLNQFRIIVDADNSIAEQPNPDAEDNNETIIDLFLLNNVIEQQEPYNFAIEGDAANIILKANIDANYSDEQTYYLEIDTTELFDSPLKLSTTIIQSGGLIEWQPAMNYTDSTVYYWRTQVDQGEVVDVPAWRTSSFIYLNDEYPGWSQSHHYQFQKDEFIDIIYNEDRRFDFVKTYTELATNNAHYPVLPSSQIDYSINGSRIYDVEACELEEQGMYLVLLNENFTPLQNYQLNAATNEGLYGSWICKSTLPVFLFPTADLAGQEKLRDFFNTELPNIIDVSYVLIYSLNNYQPQSWNTDVFDAFANYGITEIQNSSTLGGVPYTALLNLNTETVEEVIGENLNDIVEGIFLVEGSWNNGKIRSTPINITESGQWGSVHWKINELEANDIAYLNIYGIDNNAETLLLANLTDPIYYFENNEIDASIYEQIRLELVLTDSMNQTAPQLEYWRVLDFEDTDGDLIQNAVDDCPEEAGIPENNGCPCIKLNVKVLLEGVYDATTGDMSTALGSERRLLPGQTPSSPSAIPTSAGQPYNIAPWNYQGTEGTGFDDSSYSEDVVDWVLVSVRTDSNKASEIGQVAGLLMKDGVVLTMSQCAIETNETEPLYVVIEHRNHMGVMSSIPIALSDSQINYDFSLQNSYTGLTGSGQKEIAPGIWTMYSGDMNQFVDLQSYDINALDELYWENINGMFEAYTPADLNMDGSTDGIDKMFWEENNGVSSRVPK